MKLYELADQYRRLKDALHATNQDYGTIPDNESESIEFYLGTISDDFNAKVENTALVLAELEAEVAALDAEIERLAARKNNLASSCSWLKRYLQNALETTGIDRVKGTLRTISLRKCPASVVIQDESLVPGRFKTIEEVTTTDKRAILAHYKNTGEVVEGCEFVTDKKSLSIK